MFRTQQAVFCVTRNIFGNAKQLAPQGGRKLLRSRRFLRGETHAGVKIFTYPWAYGLSVKILLMEKEKQARSRGKGGRPPKTDTAKNCIMVRLTDEEHARFLTMFEQSGVLSRAAFVKARVFGEEFHVIRSDHGTMEYAARLTVFNVQLRKIGVNYNQVVKELHTHFSQKKALALLYKLENETSELVAVGEKILALTKEFKAQW